MKINRIGTIFTIGLASIVALIVASTVIDKIQIPNEVIKKEVIIENILKRQTGENEVSLADIEDLFREHTPSFPPSSVSYAPMPDIKSLNSKLDSIYLLLKPESELKATGEKIIVQNSSCKILTHSAWVYAGKRIAFAIITDDITKGKITREPHISIYRAYVIDNEGQYIQKKEKIEGENVNLTYPVEGFEISTDQLGSHKVYVETEGKSDTINATFKEKTINYSIFTDINPQPKNYDISLKICFSDEVIYDFYADVELKILQNSEEQILRDTIYIPSGTSEFRRTLVHEITGRKPYEFEIIHCTFKELEPFPHITYKLNHHEP